jgi:hypothetical protein
MVIGTLLRLANHSSMSAQRQRRRHRNTNATAQTPEIPATIGTETDNGTIASNPCVKRKTWNPTPVGQLALERRRRIVVRNWIGTMAVGNTARYRCGA